MRVAAEVDHVIDGLRHGGRVVSGNSVRLRKKEYQLLFALASRPGVLCTRQWLSREVWGEAFLPTSRTIDTHIKRLRKAIDRDGWTYIHTEHGMGYRFEPRRMEP